MQPFRAVAAVFAFFLLSAYASVATGQDYPKGPVRIIVPFPPGGPTDTVARMLGQKLQEFWNQPVIIDYKPGGGTVIGIDFVAKSAPDGLTIGMINSAFAVNPSLRRSMPYDTVRDLAGAVQIANLQLAIVARPDAPFSTVGELIAYGRKFPGKLTYGTPGPGSTTHLGAELLKRTAGFDMVHAPFKGSAPAHTELLGGRIDLMFDPFLSVQPFIKAGRMKLIATLGEKRVAGFEQVPTVAESISGFTVSALLGFVVPRATPTAVTQKLSADTARALASPQIRARVEELAMEIVGSKPEQFDAFLQSEMKRWARVIADAKIEAE